MQRLLLPFEDIMTTQKAYLKWSKRTQQADGSLNLPVAMGIQHTSYCLLIKSLSLRLDNQILLNFGF